MSFNSAAECSGSANPLGRLSKHTLGVNPLTRNRLLSSTGQDLSHDIVPSHSRNSLGNSRMMEGFLRQTGPELPSVTDVSFDGFSLWKGPTCVGTSSETITSGLNNHWASEFGRRQYALENNAFELLTRPTLPQGRLIPGTTDDINLCGLSSKAARLNMNSLSGYTPFSTTSHSSLLMGRIGLGNVGLGLTNRAHFNALQQQQQQQQITLDSSKGKSRLVELDDAEWEAQFASLELESRKIGETSDEEARKAMEKELENFDRLFAENREDELDTDLSWSDFNKGGNKEDPWNRIFHEFRTFDNSQGANLKYQFEENNWFRDVDDAFAIGMKLYAKGGNLSMAALAFEAAVQKNDQHVDAWVKLGLCQAQNEKETPAICAFEKALELDERHLEALMGLAVSYTNEGCDSSACRTLKRWLGAKYPQILEAEGENLQDEKFEFGVTSLRESHDKVTKMFIKAAQLSPEGAQMDPDVQVGLGVLFYGAEEYDKAIDCFSAALASTESGTTNDQHKLHLLWNRLGATLANSGRSEEAIVAYEKALELRPNFVRALYNLGVSCINIGCFRQAAQQFLTALAMHRRISEEDRAIARDLLNTAPSTSTASNQENPSTPFVTDADLQRVLLQNPSANLYETLRRVLYQMGRHDLGNLVGPDMDLGVFRADFEF